MSIIKLDIMNFSFVNKSVLGLCYAIIPALELLAQVYPEVEIALIVGGVIVGHRFDPHSKLSDWFMNAIQNFSVQDFLSSFSPHG